MIGYFPASTLLLAQSAAQQPGIGLELKEYKIYLVQSKKPYKYLDKENKVRESRTAYLVKFFFVKTPKPSDTVIKFYIGEYKVPEYGGVDDGIYFLIIEPGLLDRLDNQAINYSFGTSDRVSLNKTFKKPDTSSMKVEMEESVLKQRL
jgi:hypothetical protein